MVPTLRGSCENYMIEYIRSLFTFLSDWSQTHYVAQADLELAVPLLLPTEC
jgi:hypothetical protein